MLAKLRGCLATPPEVTGAPPRNGECTAVRLGASEPRMRLRRKSRLSVRVGCPSRAGTGTRSEGRVRGSGSEARTAADVWVGEEPWGPGPAGCSQPHPTRSSQEMTPNEVPAPTFGASRQVCGRARPMLGVCGPPISSRVEGGGQRPPFQKNPEIN